MKKLLSNQESWDKIDNILWPDSHEEHTFPQDYVDAIKNRELKKTKQVGENVFVASSGRGTNSVDYFYGTGEIEMTSTDQYYYGEKLVYEEGITVIGRSSVHYTLAKSVFLPDTLTEIQGFCFYYANQLKEIIIPKNVERLGVFFLYRSNSLEKISVDPENTHFFAEDNILYKNLNDGNIELVRYLNKNNKKYNMPEECTKISEANGASYNPTVEEIKISRNIKEIPMWSFVKCSNLKKIEMQDQVKTIDKESFENDENLQQVILYAISPPTLGSDAFKNCHSDLKIYVPDSSVNNYKGAAGWSEYADIIDSISNLPQEVTE